MLSARDERSCFESKLAGLILDQPEYFSRSLRKVSLEIINLLTHPSNQKFLEKNTILTDDIIQQLYSDTHFGKLGDAIHFCPSQHDFIQTIIAALSEKDIHLPKVLHIHHVFIQSIFDKLPHLSNDPDFLAKKKSLLYLLFYNELFRDVRIKVNPQGGELTTTAGIFNNLECFRLSTTELHKNVIGVFAANSTHPWVKNAEQHNFPFIAGPSGHIGSAILLAKMVAQLNQAELKEYVTANVGILTGGGFHSFHEIMSVGNKTDIPYVAGQYYHILPESFLQSDAMKNLAKEYPHLLPPQVSHYDNTVSNSVVNSAVHGFIRGCTNSLGQFAIRSGMSVNKANMTKQFIYYGVFFSMKYSEYSQLHKTGDSFNAIYCAALETGSLLAVETALDGISRLSNQISNVLQKKGWQTEPGFKLMNSLLNVGIFGYAASKQDIGTAILSTGSGIAAQILTEKVINAIGAPQ